jgi:hypothetical protein
MKVHAFEIPVVTIFVVQCNRGNTSGVDSRIIFPHISIYEYVEMTSQNEQ